MSDKREMTIRGRRGRICAAALLSFASVALFVSAAEEGQISLKCLRPSHRYRVEEKAEFLVDTPQPGVGVEVRICRVDKVPLSLMTTTTPARVSFGLEKPGFIRCWAKRTDGVGGYISVGAAFDPDQLRTSLPPPDDYDKFWEDAFKELDSIPADYVKRKIAKGVYAVSCNTVNGKKQYGFLRLPEGPGPYPLRVFVRGGDAYLTEENALSGGTPVTSAKLMIHLPPYEPVAKDGKEFHNKWLKEKGLDRFIYENLDKEPRDIYLYNCILGGCRLMDLAVAEPSIDRARITYAGASHGGGFGVYLTAFRPYIRAAFCGVPNFGNLSGAADGRPPGVSDNPLRKIWPKLRYFDAAYCARRITVPVFMSVGFTDDACAPDSVYPVYNELRGPKFMFDKVDHGHGDGPPEYIPLYECWLKNVIPSP